MKRRIIAFCLAALMIFGMLPTFVMAEESAQTTFGYEAAVATTVTVDGSLTETDWFTGGKLSGGQAFDILWDGANLYFAVEAGEADTELIVTVGEETLLTAGKNGANAIEAKAAYTTKDVTTIENVTLAVGESTWTGNVELVQMARTEALTKATMPSSGTTLTGYAITETSDGDGLVFAMPALDGPNTQISTQYIMKSPTTTLVGRTTDTALEFTLDPAAFPVVKYTGTVGQSNSVWSGLEVILADDAGKGLCFGIANAGDNGLFMNVVHKATLKGSLQLGKQSGDAPFVVKALWKSDDTLEVFVDGVSVGTVAGATVPSETMDTSSYTQDNMVHLRATRYDHNEENGHYTQPLEFTMSDIRLSKAVEVVYGTDAPVTAAGTHEALVASDIVLDGKLSETAWLPYNELGLGQDFDVLFDGNNLYFGVEAFTGDTEMTIAIGGTTVAQVGLGSNASAFETSVEYLTKDVTTIEDVTITVGQSVWTGSINLIKYVRKELMSDFSMGGDVAPMVYENGVSFNIPADAENTSKDYRAYALKTSCTTLSQRGNGIRFEFDFDPTDLAAHAGAAQSASGWTANAGFNAVLIGPDKERIVFGIDNIEDTGLMFIIQTATWGQRSTYNLGRTADEGVFHLSLEWAADGNVNLYVDGEYLTSFADKQFVHPTETTVNAMLMEARRFRSYNAVDVEFKTHNMVFSLPAELTYITDETKSDGAFTALFTDSEPDVSFGGWSDVTWENFAAGEGKAAALIYNQKVYLAVSATGAVSATLNGETKTATADGLTVLAFENTTVSNYGETLALTVSVDDTAVWAAEGVVTVGQAAVGGTVTVLDSTLGVVKSHNVTPNAEDNSITIISDAAFPMYNNSNCAYWIYNKADLANAYDSSVNNLLEQTIRVDEMPIGDVTGGYNYPNQYQGWGYTTMLEFPSAVTAGQYDFFTSVVYPDAEGNLYLSIITPDRASVHEPVALGKKLKEEFKLGMLCSTDGSQTIYVDGVEVAVVTDARVTSGKIYGSAVMLKYMDPITQTEGSENASLTVKDVTVSKTGVKELIDLEAEITQEVIFGDLDLTNVTANLPLATTFQSAYLGEHTLRWTSSNEEVVETNGNIHPSLTKELDATLSVYLDDSETALWSVDVVLPPSSSSLDALLSETEIVVDGNLSEVAWLNWKNFTNPAGNIAAAWTKGNLFFAVHSAEADTLKLTINGKEITVDLAAATISGAEGATIVKNAKTGVVEIGMPLTAIDFNLTDYNQNVLFKAELVKGDTVSELNAMLLVFSGTIAEVQALSSYTKDNGPWTLLTDTISYNGTEPGKVNYVYKTNTNLDHTDLIVMSNDFQFDALPITTGNMINVAAQADGFYYYFSDEDASSRRGTTICVSIFTEDGTNLKMRLGQGAGTELAVFDLGKTLGEKFRVTHYWYANNTLELYVDGVLIGSIANAGYATSYLGVDVITYRYYSEKVSTEKVKFTISNQTFIKEKYETVLDELTPNVVFGRIDLDHVQKDLPMVTTFASVNFEALNLKWTSSDESVVAADGTVTRHATEAKSAVVTVYFIDDEGNEIELWSVTVTVDPMTVTKQEAPAIIHTAFTAPGTVTLDGALTDEGWLLNGWVLNADDQPEGYFATQWDQEYLYVALDTAAEAVNLTLGDKEITVDLTNETITGVEGEIAVDGTIAEVKIPVSELFGVDKLEAYDETLAIAVEMGEGVYEGTLNLTNVDWWATDNIYSGLPMLENNVKSVKMGTSDTPDGNQGAKQLENGWHLYDLYNPEGTNPAGIRTYVLFMKMPVYENFADRTEATHIEFDFNAKALPEWEWDEALKAEIGRAFANYGVTFSLSDKADSNKNSNVAVFGIVNTADGLYLVVNRGSEDYDGYPLNKQVGEEFRIGLTWLTNSNLVLSIDGEEFMTIEGMSKFVNAVGDTSFVVNMLRNKVKPTSSADDMDVYLTNIAFGKAHSTENVIRNLTFADFAGQNESEDDIQHDLELPAYMTNGQLDHQYAITWTSSDEATIDPATGKVTRPEHGVKVVTLTATLDNNGVTETKTFSLIVMGYSVDNGNVLIITDDTNPFSKAGYEYTGLLFNLDKTNNSVVYAFSEDAESTKINLVTLTDLDEFSSLNRESLRLFVSDDNATYTEIEDYKLHHDGENWYLYGFEADARYIKAHYTHRDHEYTDFVNTPGEMIHVSWNESLVVPESAAEIDVPATTLLDEAAAITLPEGVTAENLRVTLNGEFLFHYVEADGTVIVRIPDPTTGTLKLWNAEGLELADKENVYEVTYGTRETLPTSGRWVLGMKAGQTFPDGSSLTVDTLYHMSGKSVYASTDGGYTWSRVGGITFFDGLSSGGWGIDSKTGRLFHEFYGSVTFNGSDITQSSLITYVFYSDDGGKTWTQASGLGKVEGDLQSNYVLSYTDLTELAGNDGEGPNVDFVFPMGAQYNNNGAFCGRVAYTTDGGLSWNYSESKITYGNETAFEGGVSEATILERADGTLVYYARCQSSGVDNFTISYSLDHGVTWLTPGLTSGIYTTNTQALMMTYDFDGFDGNRLTGVPMFMWGGNNVLGGSSYMRMPMNFATSTNEMDTFRDIQNIFFETFMDDFTYEADHYITNPSVQQIDGDNMYLTFSRLRQGDSVYMVVNDFTDWFVRTKGAYDSFEGGPAASEGWNLAKGAIETTSTKVSAGDYSLLIKENTQVTRSVPYLQNGTMSIDLYVDANSKFVFELQPAFATTVQKCAVISAEINGTTMTFADGTVLTLTEGWNTVSFELNLTEDEVSISINGGAAVALTTDVEAGDWISYVTVLATSDVYVDEMLIVETEDVVLEATDEDKAAAEEVIDMIKALEAGDTDAIEAAKAAYDALTQVQQDLVNRNVPTGTTDKVNEEGSLINYYDVLMGLLEGTAKEEFYGSSMTLGNDLSMNFYIEAEKVPEGAYAEITFKGETETVQMADLTAENGFYRIVYSGMAAKEMTDEFTVQIFAADGTAVTEARTDSTRAYAMRVLAKEETGAELKTALVDMLNYGAAAQEHFNYKTDDLANNQLTDEQKALATESVTMTDSRVKGDGYVGTSLSLENNILLNFYFSKAAVGKTATVTYTGYNGEENSCEVEVAANGSMGIVCVDTLVVADASALVSVTIDGVTVTDSVESYCARMTTLALREPLMKFATSAKEFFEQ